MLGTSVRVKASIVILKQTSKIEALQRAKKRQSSKTDMQ